MEIFYNRERPNYEEIVSYGPRWLTEYREMDANYKYAGWTLDLMAYWLERIVNNEFPGYADEKTICMWERLLGIETDPNILLAERRRVVEAYLAGTGKMNRSTIESLVKSYAGQECDVYWTGEILRIQFDYAEGVAVSISTLLGILRRRMPAHIKYIVNNRVLIALDSEDLEKMYLRKIYLRIRISFFGNPLFDGSWKFDGSILLNGQRNYNLKVSMKCKGDGITTEEDIDSPVMRLRIRQNIHEVVKGVRIKNRSGIHFMENLQLREKVLSKSRVSICIDINSQLERVGEAAVYTVRKDSWHFDGSNRMDGSRYFNSLFKEEEL